MILCTKLNGIRIVFSIQSLGYKHESFLVFIWTNVILLSIGSLRRNCIEFLAQLNNFHSWKWIWKYRLQLRRSLFPTCLSPKKERKDKSKMTSSNGNIFRVTGPLCGEFTGPGEFPAQRPVTHSVDVFFDMRLNKRLNEQPWGWWFETPSWSLWRHDNESVYHCEYSNKAQFHRGWLSALGSYWLFPALGRANVRYTGSLWHLVGDILQRIAIIAIVTHNVLE